MKYALLILTLGLVLASCSSQAPTGQTVTNPAGNQVTTTVKDDTGTTTVTATQGADDWCAEGGEWKMTSTTGEGAHWTIDKLETSGEYAGLCHVIYTANSNGEDVRMDYYFDESGDNGYYEMNINGQTIKQEWHG